MPPLEFREGFFIPSENDEISNAKWHMAKLNGRLYDIVIYIKE